MKRQIIQALESLPDDATFEDAIEHLFFLQKLKSRIAEADKGNLIPNEEVQARMAKWPR